MLASYQQKIKYQASQLEQKIPISLGLGPFASLAIHYL
jgi:hypothetical protein